MTEYLDLSPVITGPEETTTDAGRSGIWVIVEQDEIPEEQQQVTEEEAKSMIEAALSGYSAFRGLSSCPVSKRSLGPGNYVATYTATILIHKSNQLGDYDFTVTKDGVPIPYNTPRKEYRRKSESFDIDYLETVQLGWQPYSGFFGQWNEQFGVWDTKSSRVPPANRPAIDQDDGFLTLEGELVFGIVKAESLAVMDLVTVDINHQLGRKWGSEVRAEVSWPAGAEYDQQQHEECPVLLPVCVEELFNECASEDEDGNTIPGAETDSDYYVGTFSGGPAGPVKVFWNICRRQVIQVTNDNRDTI